MSKSSAKPLWATSKGGRGAEIETFLKFLSFQYVLYSMILNALVSTLILITLTASACYLPETCCRSSKRCSSESQFDYKKNLCDPDSEIKDSGNINVCCSLSQSIRGELVGFRPVVQRICAVVAFPKLSILQSLPLNSNTALTNFHISEFSRMFNTPFRI